MGKCRVDRLTSLQVDEFVSWGNVELMGWQADELVS